MPTKITFYYQTGIGGFSETYFHPSSDPRTLAASVPNSLYQQAVKFRWSGTLLKAIRYSSVSPPRKSFLVRPYPAAQGSAGTGNDPGPDVLSTTAVFRLQGATAGERNVYLRGLADEDVKRDIFGNDILSANLRNGTNVFFLALNTNGFCIQIGVRPPDGGLSWQQIDVVKASADFPSAYSAFKLKTPPPAFQVGDKVVFNGLDDRIGKWPRAAVILGTENVLGDIYYRVEYAMPGGVTFQPANMRVVKETFTYNTIAGWLFTRFSEHKTGRPFGLLRGRVSAR